jgi:glucose/arabinose dehydrogenase
MLAVAVLAVAACGTPTSSPTARSSGTARAPSGTPSTALPPTSASPTAATTAGTGSIEDLALTLEPVAGGFAAPLFVTHAGDGSGRLFVVEQGGRIRIVRDSGRVAPEPFLDISDRISAGGERGLLGLAFHPGYATNGRLFVDYTDRNGNTVVAEYHGDADRADANVERVILRIGQPAPNHNGGWLGFGPDGKLYVATGDGGGGAAENGQRLDTLLGKLLRIDVDVGQPYTVPPGNPFAAGTRGEQPEIWAYGLRNPWRMSFDRQTGDLFIGDVGATAFEEVDVLPAGASGVNFGWPRMEGFDCNAQGGCPEDLTRPVLAYGRDQGSVVTGGYVYRGTAQPALQGVYVFGDYAVGVIWAVSAAAALRGAVTPTVVAETQLTISSFGEDEAGELYLTDLAGGGVYRLVAGGG